MEKLNQSVLEKFSINKNLIPILKDISNELVPINIKDGEEKDDFTVREEYEHLLFFIQKARNLFLFIDTAAKKLNMKKLPKTKEGIKLYISGINDTKLKESLRKLINFPQFKWLRSISEIPKNTEYTYLGNIDAHDIKKQIEEFEPIFKKYAERVLLLLESNPVESNPVVALSVSESNPVETTKQLLLEYNAQN